MGKCDYVFLFQSTLHGWLQCWTNMIDRNYFTKILTHDLICLYSKSHKKWSTSNYDKSLRAGVVSLLKVCRNNWEQLPVRWKHRWKMSYVGRKKLLRQPCASSHVPWCQKLLFFIYLRGVSLGGRITCRESRPHSVQVLRPTYRRQLGQQ